MKKIRNFKLRLHSKDLRRKAMRKFDLAKLGLGDAALHDLLGEIEAALRPAVIYESFGADSSDSADFSPIPGLAHTLGLASLGLHLEPYLERRRGGRPGEAPLLDMIAAAALHQAVHFVIGLLKSEVEAERCQLSPIQYIEEGPGLALAFDKLEGGKIDLALRGDRLSPQPAAAFCVSWVAKTRRSKKGKTSASGRKK